MDTERANPLLTNIAEIPGVGPRRAAAFRRLGVRCVADLLRHLPMRYERELPEQTIEEVEGVLGPDGAGDGAITVRGEIAAARAVPGRGQRFEATLEDGTGSVLLTWFNAPWMRGRLHPGTRVRATGKAKRFGGYLQIVNPKWEALDEATDAAPRAARLRPIYPGSDDLTSAAVEQAVEHVLEPAVAALDDHLTDAYRRERALVPLAEAYRLVHRPGDEDDVGRARRRLAFDELLLLQLGVMLKRHHRRDRLRAPALACTPTIDAHITQRFPFTLTPSQRSVVDEIVADLAVPTPMNRLLQGDVGAGKTVVALYAMLLAVAGGHQAALMAPTELLAEQHYASIRETLTGASVRLELLTGSLKAAERRALVARLEAGEVDLVIGTHAIITESVSFRSLAVAVIDEQHRVGVHQRATFRAKAGDGDATPHVLVMTATPIPRTLSLTVFGDLDVSVIRELPPGRQPIATRHVTADRAGEVYAWAAERLAAGDQAYVVVPAIDESSAGLTDVASHLAFLRRGPFAGRTVEAMHGRLKREERDAIMERFRAGAIDALVATTVIEVGVDVPNATIMIIEHADRFGLAQLHQLRGRVGRGERKSACVLVADPTTDDGAKRLEAIVATTDGFEIAERDLEIRGPGELFGAKQSGLAPFFAAQLPRDLDLLRLARKDAAAWGDPMLEAPEDALLRKRLFKAHGDALGLGDVG